MQPPPLLKEIQDWFGAVLRTPLEPGNRINPRHHKKAAAFIPPTPSLHPYERIEIYNQQYWWRLYSALQDVLPTAARLMGQRDFNRKLALPYLLAHNPDHWALYGLAENLSPWLMANLPEGLIRSMALLDRTFYSTFLSDIVSAEIRSVEAPFFLQPHIRLLSLSEDLLTARQIILNEPLKSDPVKPLVPEKKMVQVALFRKPCTGMTFWQELLPQEYELLKAFAMGATVEEALETVEEAWDVSASFAFFKENCFLCQRS